jgi:aryl-alcohol dehydrogenase-like predicted oxidoreductase
MQRVNLALGAMFLGTGQDERTSFDLLDRFVDAGGTMIDTANNYCFWESPDGTGGASERMIGAWLAARPGMRDRILLSTKVGAELAVPGGQWPRDREGLSAKAIRAGCEGSLRRLRTDRIDVYWAHMEDRSVPLAETVGVLADLVAAGTVLRLGASNHPAWRVEQAHQLARAEGQAGYDMLQLRHTYLQPRPGIHVDPNLPLGTVTSETLDYAQSEGLSIWAYQALLSGAYTRTDRPIPDSYQHPGNDHRLAVLGEVAAEIGVSRNQVVIAWLTGGAPPVTPIVGVSNLDQLDQALAGARLRLTDEQRARMNAAG